MIGGRGPPTQEVGCVIVMGKCLWVLCCGVVSQNFLGGMAVLEQQEGDLPWPLASGPLNTHFRF